MNRHLHMLAATARRVVWTDGLQQYVLWELADCCENHVLWVEQQRIEGDWPWPKLLGIHVHRKSTFAHYRFEAGVHRYCLDTNKASNLWRLIRSMQQQGLSHSDLKPVNVLWCGDTCKLLDAESIVSTNTRGPHSWSGPAKHGHASTNAGFAFLHLQQMTRSFQVGDSRWQQLAESYEYLADLDREWGTGW